MQKNADSFSKVDKTSERCLSYEKEQPDIKNEDTLSFAGRALKRRKMKGVLYPIFC